MTARMDHNARVHNNHNYQANMYPMEYMVAARDQGTGMSYKILGSTMLTSASGRLNQRIIWRQIKVL